jgi:outer membrane lipoprotein carrier protein
MDRAVTLSVCAVFLGLAAAPATADQLDDVLKNMDAAAARFQGLAAQISYTKVTVVVDDKSTERGGIFFQKEKGGRGYKVLIQFNDPDTKTVLVKGGKAEIYREKINQIEEYDIGKDRERFEQFLLLGFGAGGTQLKKAYAVTLAGDAPAAGETTYKLDLIPQGSMARHLTRIELWISKKTWQPVQQRFTEPTKDHLTVIYTNVREEPQPDSRFEIRWTGKKPTRIKPGT